MWHSWNNVRAIWGILGLSIFATALPACGGGSTPLDAETRAIIDSTSTAQIGRSRIELDSLCAATEQAKMTVLVDSIKKVRLKEIDQQMRFVPK